MNYVCHGQYIDFIDYAKMIELQGKANNLRVYKAIRVRMLGNKALRNQVIKRHRKHCDKSINVSPKTLTLRVH